MAMAARRPAMPLPTMTASKPIARMEISLPFLDRWDSPSYDSVRATFSADGAREDLPARDVARSRDPPHRRTVHAPSRRAAAPRCLRRNAEAAFRRRDPRGLLPARRHRLGGEQRRGRPPAQHPDPRGPADRAPGGDGALEAAAG